MSLEGKIRRLACIVTSFLTGLAIVGAVVVVSIILLIIGAYILQNFKILMDIISLIFLFYLSIAAIWLIYNIGHDELVKRDIKFCKRK